MNDWKISKTDGTTVVDVPEHGRFKIWTQGRGRFRRPLTHIEHTGQFDLEVYGFDFVRGISHRQALHRLAEHVNEWATLPMPRRTQQP